MLSIQKSPSDKTDLGFEDSISVFKTHSINFVSSFEPPLSEIVKPVEVTPPRKIRVYLKESKPIKLWFTNMYSVGFYSISNLIVILFNLLYLVFIVGFDCKGCVIEREYEDLSN